MCNHAEQAAEGGTLAVWRFQVYTSLYFFKFNILFI